MHWFQSKADVKCSASFDDSKHHFVCVCVHYYYSCPSHQGTLRAVLYHHCPNKILISLVEDPQVMNILFILCILFKGHTWHVFQFYNLDTGWARSFQLSMIIAFGGIYRLVICLMTLTFCKVTSVSETKTANSLV